MLLLIMATSGNVPSKATLYSMASILGKTSFLLTTLSTARVSNGNASLVVAAVPKTGFVSTSFSPFPDPHDVCHGSDAVNRTIDSELPGTMMPAMPCSFTPAMTTVPSAKTHSTTAPIATLPSSLVSSSRTTSTRTCCCRHSKK